MDAEAGTLPAQDKHQHSARVTMEGGLTELFLGVTAASLLPPAIIAAVQKLWRTRLANND
jgi:hypothetical protein